MSKILVLAEKPSVARDIARVLNCNKKGNGYIEGSKYIVTWALGHLVTLANPEQYDEKYKKWDMSDIPIIPKYFKFVVIKNTSKQFNAVKSQIQRDDVSEIVIATDAGREGELVARLILEKVKNNKPIKRLWISSVTDKAIREGFSRLKDGSDYNNLYASALARAESDWIVGINATRALTCKYNAQLSCGRVQTPTLSMIHSREEEIRKFKAQKYFGIDVFSGNLKLSWVDSKTNSSRSFNEEKIDTILNKIKNKDILIEDVSKKVKKLYAPKLYDLTELQRDANRIWGYSAKETLSIMQRLYEHHKVLTYPRTDSKYISEDIVDTLKDRVKAARDVQREAAKEILSENIKANKNFVDNTKVSDHHAIIPTEETPDFREFTNKERNIYELVVRRFFSNLLKPSEYEEAIITSKIENESFKAKGKRVINEGWKKVYSGYDLNEEKEETSQIIDNIEKNKSIKITKYTKTKGETTPPALFNEGTLLGAMENPIKYMESHDKSLAKTLGETGGLGTVATRADIIDKLFSSFLIEKRGKDIITTSKGKQLLNLVPEDLKSPEMTGKWEQNLTQISKGTLKREKFLGDIKEYSKKIVNDIKNSEEKFRHDNLSTDKCPNCGKLMLRVNTKTGRSLVCQDRECGYRKNVATLTNSRCPNCHKKLELRGEGEGKIFVCSCGHREKLSSFNARKSKAGKAPSKREVNSYLNKQKKEANEPMNTALKDALSKLFSTDN